MRLTTQTIAALVLGIVAGAVAMRIAGSPSQQIGRDLADPGNWTLIRLFDGTVDPSEGQIQARVYVAMFPPPESEGDPILQNKIEVTTGSTTARFQWPDSQSFAGGICDLTDLDKDGVLEFVLRAGEQRLRIVEYRRGTFRFREGPGPGTDVLHSSRPIEILDLDGNGQPEFITYTLKDYSGSPDLELHVSQWTAVGGFHIVDGTLLAAYRTKTSPSR